MRMIKNRKEALKAQVIGECVKGKMTVRAAAERLDLSERQVQNLKAQYRKGGASTMLHGNCGRQPSHTLTPEVKQRVLEIKRRPEYAQVNFAHFREELEEEYEIKISYTALSNLLKGNGFKSPKKRRKRKTRHPRRERRPCFGDMLQTDATPFDWFGKGESYALHAFIDDATSKLTGMYMTKNECAEGYFQIMRQTITDYGVPQSIYADGLSLFFGTKEPSIEEQLEGKTVRTTRFGAIAEQLGTHLIHARSPEAKGRVERLWQTLQSRLPIEFLKRSITTVEEANEFLYGSYIETYNNRFEREPESPLSAFLAKPKGIQLDTLLSMRYERTVDNSGCFSFNGVLCRCNVPGIKPRAKIEILVNGRIGVKVLYNSKLFTPVPVLDKKKRQVTGSSIEAIIAAFMHECCFKNEHIARLYP
jgi:transposase